MIVGSLTGCLMRCSVQLQRWRHDQGTAFLFPDRTNCKADSRASFCISFLFQEYGIRHFTLPLITSYQNTTALCSSYMQLLYGGINAWDWWELNGAYQDGPSNGPASAR
jgi:hypothetical protein